MKQNSKKCIIYFLKSWCINFMQNFKTPPLASPPTPSLDAHGVPSLGSSQQGTRPPGRASSQEAYACWTPLLGGPLRCPCTSFRISEAGRLSCRARLSRHARPPSHRLFGVPGRKIVQRNITEILHKALSALAQLIS